MQTSSCLTSQIAERLSNVFVSCYYFLRLMLKVCKVKRIFLQVLVLFIALPAIQAQKAEIFSTGGNAIHGYDVVAFFEDSAEVIGSEDFSYEWKGVSWLFSTQANKDIFIANPSKYEPQYGGYCAYGTSNGYKAPTEINTWTLLNGKLYFNYNTKVKDIWDKNRSAYIEKADANWVLIKDKE